MERISRIARRPCREVQAVDFAELWVERFGKARHSWGQCVTPFSAPIPCFAMIGRDSLGCPSLTRDFRGVCVPNIRLEQALGPGGFASAFYDRRFIARARED